MGMSMKFVLLLLSVTLICSATTAKLEESSSQVANLPRTQSRMLVQFGVVDKHVKHAYRARKGVERTSSNKKFRYTKIGKAMSGSLTADKAMESETKAKKVSAPKKSNKVKYSNKKFEVGMAKGEKIPMKVQKAIERIGAKPNDTKKGAVGKYNYLLVHITKIEKN